MRKFLVSMVLPACAVIVPFGAIAQTEPQPGRPFVSGYDATIWVDPDGCQHWVMDLGNEGFMSPRLDKNGKPVCGPITDPVVGKYSE